MCYLWVELDEDGVGALCEGLQHLLVGAVLELAQTIDHVRHRLQDSRHIATGWLDVAAIVTRKIG